MKKQQPAELGGSEETKPAKPTVTPARRVENVEEYYFSVKLKEVARMNESGARVINLGIGSPDLPPSAETVQALCQATPQAVQSRPAGKASSEDERICSASLILKWLKANGCSNHFMSR
mgnify:CR=1 FL=1